MADENGRSWRGCPFCTRGNCAACDGTGYYIEEQNHPPYECRRPCDTCGGDGVCGACNGRGAVLVTDAQFEELLKHF